MLNFKSTTIIFIIAISMCLLLNFFFQTSLLPLIFLSILYSALFIYGITNIQSNFFIKANCNKLTSEKIIAITFDDGPNNEFTPEALKTLANYNAKATFFVIGKNIKSNENIIKQMDSEGHTIGNHSFSHSFFIDFKNANEFVKELNQTSDEVYNIIGKRMNYFRPPYGVTTPHLAKASQTLNYNIIGWNVRSLDTTKDNEEKITKRIINKIQPGSIILLHDTSQKSINVLKQTLNFVQKNGFKIVSIEELLNIKPYQ